MKSRFSAQILENFETIKSFKLRIVEMKNEEVLLRVNEQRNILHEIRKRKANCIGHISHLKEEALDRTMWRRRFGGGFGPVVRQNTE